MASVFLKEEKFATKWYILFSVYVKPVAKGRIYADEKPTFSKRAWHLQG